MKVLRVFSLLMAVSMLLWIAGCGGNDDDDDCDSADNVPPIVTLSPAGGDVASNAVITATCSKPVETLTVSGGVVAISSDSKVWTFSLPEGDGQSVTVEGTDPCGDSGSTSATFNVIGHHHEAELLGNECNPKDGAEDVGPDGISKLIVKFSKALASAEIQRFEPDIPFDAELDGDTLTISFLGGANLSNEQEVEVEIDTRTLSGDTSSVTYSFTTKAKE